MIKSMTGFAAVTREASQASVTVTIKSVNHRYLDVQLRLPSSLAELEPDMRALVQAHAARGRVEVGVTVQRLAAPDVELEVHEPLVKALSAAAERAREQGLISGGLTAGDVLRFPQVVTVRERPPEETAWRALCDQVRDATGAAARELDAMRSREGEFLERDLGERSAELRSLVDRIVAEAAAGDAALRTRLTNRVAELGTQVEVDPNAVAQEVVRWAARSDIHEEVARLSGHLEHIAQLSREPTPCGRKLDFLVQEMNREVNTIGSKAEGREIAQLVVAAKAEIEKMREQVQNVE